MLHLLLLKVTKPLPITEAKKKDLFSLLQFIPVIFYDYYKNLLTDKNQRDVLIDLADEEIEED